MHMIKTLTRLGAIALVSMTLLSACKQEQPPNAREMNPQQVEKLAYLAKNFDKSDLSNEERMKVGDLFSKLSYEEMEALIDLRYQQSLRTQNVDANRATYLRDLRHRINRQAYELNKKPFQQLGYADSEKVLQLLKPNASGTPAVSKVGGRTASTCIATAPCTPWRPNGSLSNNPDANATWIKGTYVGERTLQCSDNTYQDDCDYVFRYNFSKIYQAVNWRSRGVLFLIGDGVATRIIDVNPDKIDCGLYVLDLMAGKDRVDWLADGPQGAVEFFELGLTEQIWPNSCYIGTWGTEKWYHAGVYISYMDGWGLNRSSVGYSPCLCTVDGKSVL